MNSKNIPIIGLALAAFIAFFPGNQTPSDSLDQADDAYREKLAAIIEKFKDEDKSDKTKESFITEFSAARQETHSGVRDELLSLWWNGKAEEAAKRLREHKTTGIKEVTPDE